MAGFLRWFARTRPFPYERDTAFSAMALIFVVGGVTALLTAALPHPSTLPYALTITIGLVSPVIGISIYFLRRRLPIGMIPWVVPSGTVLVTVLVATAGTGSASASFGLFYLWIAMYSVLFLPPRGVAIQAATAAIAYGAVLGWVRPSGMADFTALEPLVLMSVIGTTCVVVFMLTRAREMSEIDPLTGTLNRRGLERFLTESSARVMDRNEDVVVAMLDLDHFKAVNDTSGHDAGDELLRDVAERWRSVLRPEDCLSRFGGDEFVIVLPGCNPSDASAIVERLRLAGPEGVTCSVGVATWRWGEADTALLKRADAALYDAKRLGRNRIEWGSHPDHEERRRPRS